jgi:toxin YoeB
MIETKRISLHRRNVRHFEQNPYQNPLPYEKLAGDLSGAGSRRINIQHRLVYQMLETGKIVKVLRMWTHDE